MEVNGIKGPSIDIAKATMNQELLREPVSAVGVQGGFSPQNYHVSPHSPPFEGTVVFEGPLFIFHVGLGFGGLECRLSDEELKAARGGQFLKSLSPRLW